MNHIKMGLAAAVLVTVGTSAAAQVRDCAYVDGVRRCVPRDGTTVIIQRRSGDYLEAYGRNRQIRKANEAAEQDALERRACRAEAMEAVDAKDYKRAKALAEICP